MTMTPWGDSEALRERQLPPGAGVAREAVVQNQRERLYGATVAVVANRGYRATTVADLTDLAGVSRTTFYRYFADKEACFLATLELIIAGVIAETRGRLDAPGSLPERAESGLRGFLGCWPPSPTRPVSAASRLRRLEQQRSESSTPRSPSSRRSWPASSSSCPTSAGCRRRSPQRRSAACAKSSTLACTATQRPSSRKWPPD
ncbi:MAG: TetR/AcrR family transcriptional regulator [Solirubrobacterales bacterium]|nr:TetR/AcrR family transcriptional regulator [Solirubrobacterales bacterium]